MYGGEGCVVARTNGRIAVAAMVISGAAESCRRVMRPDTGRE